MTPSGGTPLTIVLQALERAGVPFAFIGAAARNVWAPPRRTTDIDFAVLADAVAFARVEAELGGVGWQLACAHRVEEDDPVPAVAIFRNEDVEPPYRQVDLLLAGTDFETQAVRGAVRRPLAGTDAPVVRREDLVIYKLVAWRRRDRQDVEDVMATAEAAGEDLDVDHLRRWAEEWEVEDRLERVLAPSGRDVG